MKNTPTAAEKIRAGVALLPPEEAALRQALVAISKAVEAGDRSEWALVHIRCAMDFLDIAAYHAMRVAMRNSAIPKQEEEK